MKQEDNGTKGIDESKKTKRYEERRKGGGGEKKKSRPMRVSEERGNVQEDVEEKKRMR